jgi:predicted component of type VI protein secretion system
MFRSDGERRSFSIARDMTVIGRREDCDLRIPLGDVSRKHCRLVRDGDMLKVEDLGSSNGTYLNGRRVQEALLSPGDSIQVGPVVFVLQVDGEPADDQLNPIAVPMAGDAVGSGMVSQAGATTADEVEELEPLSDEGSDAALEELGDDDEMDSPTQNRPSEPEELEPVEELDALAPDDILEESPSSASGSRIEIDSDEKRG